MAQFQNDKEAADSLKAAYQQLRQEIGKVIVGQDEVVRLVLTAVFAQGHCLLVGVPGLAKTLLIQTIADSLDLSFNRIQFTPDLMPSDIVGSETLTQQRGFQFVKGPIFANIILADEINRTPPKTQAALLESMQEYAVTVAGQRYPLQRNIYIISREARTGLGSGFASFVAGQKGQLIFYKSGLLPAKMQVRIVTTSKAD